MCESECVSVIVVTIVPGVSGVLKGMFCCITDTEIECECM